MFEYVADRSKLVQDKTTMFGVFELGPSLLAIHPGLKPTFKRFIAKVENLVPKRKAAASSQEPPAKCTRKTLNSTPKSSQNDSKPSTVEYLSNLFLKWA